MQLTVSIACLNKVELTLQCLNCLRSNSSNLKSIQFILTDNGSTDTTFSEISSFPLPNKLIIRNRYNVGFGEAHNTALDKALGSYLLVLNNDLFINERGWDSKLISLLERSGNAIVGIRGVHCTFRPDGTGYKGNRVDYLEGSFLAGSTVTFRTYGLFSHEIKMFTCEDSDLSMRYKQMGFKLYQIGMNFKHMDHATLDSLDHSYKSRVYESNRKILNNRWSKCFGVDRLKNKVLVSLSSVGIGDILCSTPTLKALRKDHPTAQIDVETRFAEVFKNHPEVKTIISYGKADHNQYDRVVKLDPDYSKDVPMYKEFERLASVTLENRFPEIYLTKEEIDAGKRIIDPIRYKYRNFIVCSLLMKRVVWQGRNWTLENKKEFISLLRKAIPEDYGIIEVGRDIPSTGLSDLDLVNKTSIRELFSVINQCDIFVGIDSLPFHVAQAFKMKSVVLFGATKPKTRIIDHSLVSVIRNERLDCLNCYHDKREKGFNTCDRRDQACMVGIEPKDVVKKVVELM